MLDPAVSNMNREASSLRTAVKGFTGHQENSRGDLDFIMSCPAHHLNPHNVKQEEGDCSAELIAHASVTPCSDPAVHSQKCVKKEDVVILNQEDATFSIPFAFTMKDLVHPQTMAFLPYEDKTECASENEDCEQQSTQNYPLHLAIKRETCIEVNYRSHAALNHLHFNAEAVIKREGSNYSDAVPTSITAFPNSLHSQTSTKNEALMSTDIPNTIRQRKYSLITPLPSMDDVHTQTMMYQQKTESESENIQDCEQQSTLDYPPGTAIKKEIRYEVNQCLIDDDMNMMKNSGVEEVRAEINEHSSDLSDDAIMKSENNKSPESVPNADINDEQEIMSDTTSEEIDQQNQCNLMDKEKMSFQKCGNRLSSIDETDYTCSLCGEIFNRHQSYLLHMWHIHTAEKPYSCELCGKAFKQRHQLKRHEISHSDERPHSCDMCEKTFKSKRHLWHHEIVCHSNEKPQFCDICKKSFKHKCYLEKHKTVCHSNETPYSCEVCEKSFKYMGGLKAHIVLCHSDERPHFCHVCGKTFKLKYILVKHKKLCHSNERPYSCDVCGKSFKQKCQLAEHRASSHSKEKPYSCDHCNKTFKFKHNLQKHKKLSHSNERPFSCDVCGQAFHLKYILQNHKVRCHSGEMPYSCDVCGKGFKYKSSVKPHKEACHSNETSHSCDVCGKTYKRHSILWKHKNTVHSNERPFSCNVCGKTFKCKDHIARHMAALHSDERGA